MTKAMIVNSEKCVGCELCWQACSLKKEQRFSVAKARVVVSRWYPKEIAFQTMCEHCELPLCKDACPSNAIWRDATTGIVSVQEDLCTGCKICVLACPIGAIALHPGHGYSLKCDACGGKPQCAVVCPTDAIVFVDDNGTQTIVKKELVKKNFERRASVDAIMLVAGSKKSMTGGDSA